MAAGVLWDGLQGGRYRIQRSKGSQLLIQCWVKERVLFLCSDLLRECKKEVKFTSAQLSPTGDK